MFDLGLNENQTRLRDLAKKVTEEKLMPFAEKVDEQNRFSWENFDALKSAGFMGLTVPSIYGGGEASEFECVLVQEEITRGSTSAGSLLENHMMATDALLQAASESQKEHYFPRFATAEILGTLAITEPEAGSDVKAIRTLAERVPEGYRINGTKRFISLADVAGAYIVLAKTDPAKRHKGMSTFIVGRTTKGVSLGKKEEKMGQRGLLTADVILEDCVVPDSALLGEENQGFKVMLHALNRSRITMGAQAVGIARAAYEEALSYAKKRETFGTFLIKHQAIGFMLADMATELNAARFMVYNAARVFDLKGDFVSAAAMAKLFASEMSNRVVNKAVQIHGGYGFIKDYPVERYYRDQRVMELYGGTSEMMRMTIAKNL